MAFIGHHTPNDVINGPPDSGGKYRPEMLAADIILKPRRADTDTIILQTGTIGILYETTKMIPGSKTHIKMQNYLDREIKNLVVINQSDHGKTSRSLPNTRISGTRQNISPRYSKS
ncbi:MAG: hypothetical protein MZV70_30490 [Desulfobacterales bacterium]|nr:hypothetical protein [Desulfobacterales bacterium]